MHAVAAAAAPTLFCLSAVLITLATYQTRDCCRLFASSCVSDNDRSIFRAEFENMQNRHHFEYCFIAFGQDVSLGSWSICAHIMCLCKGPMHGGCICLATCPCCKNLGSCLHLQCVTEWIYTNINLFYSSFYLVNNSALL